MYVSNVFFYEKLIYPRGLKSGLKRHYFPPKFQKIFAGGGKPPLQPPPRSHPGFAWLTRSSCHVFFAVWSKISQCDLGLGKVVAQCDFFFFHVCASPHRQNGLQASVYCIAQLPAVYYWPLFLTSALCLGNLLLIVVARKGIFSPFSLYLYWSILDLLLLKIPIDGSARILLFLPGLYPDLEPYKDDRIRI